MSRNALKLSIAVAVVALSTLVVSTIARPGIGNPIVEQVNTTRPDFDRVFSDAASVSFPAFTDVDRETLRQIGLKRINGARPGR
jgi:hypothetical protein